MGERVAGIAVVGLVHGMEGVLTTLHHPRFQLVAVCDLDQRKYEWITGRSRVEESGSEVAAFPTHLAWVRQIRDHPSIGSVEYEKDFQKLLERDDVEAVALAVPDLLHRDFAIAALEAGKYVLCAKPMAATLEGARDIAAAADRHPGRFMLGLQRPYSPFAAAVLDLVDRGLVGEPRQVRLDHHRHPWRPAHSYKFSPVDGALPAARAGRGGLRHRRDHRAARLLHDEAEVHGGDAWLRRFPMPSVEHGYLAARDAIRPNARSSSIAVCDLDECFTPPDTRRSGSHRRQAHLIPGGMGSHCRQMYGDFSQPFTAAAMPLMK